MQFVDHYIGQKLVSLQEGYINTSKKEKENSTRLNNKRYIMRGESNKKGIKRINLIWK